MQNEPGPVGSRTLIVSNLPQGLSENDLYIMMAKMGPVEVRVRIRGFELARKLVRSPSIIIRLCMCGPALILPRTREPRVVMESMPPLA